MYSRDCHHHLNINQGILYRHLNIDQSNVHFYKGELYHYLKHGLGFLHVQLSTQLLVQLVSDFYSFPSF